jgi:hypothetical protein
VLQGCHKNRINKSYEGVIESVLHIEVMEVCNRGVVSVLREHKSCVAMTLQGCNTCDSYLLFMKGRRPNFVSNSNFRDSNVLAMLSVCCSCRSIHEFSGVL